MQNHTGQSPGVLVPPKPRLQSVAEFWAGFEEIRSTPGGTHDRDVLDSLYAEYCDIVGRFPIDIGQAESLTAEAAMMLLGKRTG